jgi:1-phosphofructokinase
MIVTVTPNPSVDRTVFLDEIVLGSVNRSQRSWSEPSGKGVNVALALHAHGEPVCAVLPAGGSVGAQLHQMLDSAGLDTVLVPIAGEIRSNVSLVSPDGSVTKINEAGPVLTGSEVQCLVDAVADIDASLIVCGGSLPAGVPIDLYARIAHIAKRKSVPIVVDSSGAPLAAGIAAQPDLIKPNAHELTELTGGDLHTLGDVVDAATEIRSRGVGSVLASLGADGAILVDGEGALYGCAPVERVVSTVGAGDAMLAGYLAGCRHDRRTALATALEWGAAAVQHEGTLFSPAATPSPTVILDDAFDRRRTLRDDEPAPTAPAI